MGGRIFGGSAPAKEQKTMELLKALETIVREAGEIVLSAQNIRDVTERKTSAADLVTAYDVKVENFLKERLLALVAGAVFFGEEEKERTDPNHGWAFIVDPIDGTANFVREFRQSAVSVALAKDGIVQYGVVFDPYKDEMFTAKRGEGAFLNGEPIHVSGQPLEKGIFGMGTAPYNTELHAKTLDITRQLFARSCDFRRMGAAALDLCAVACGRLDAFFECELCPWDYAAASLLITEAGGVISTLEQEPLVLDRKISIWASNKVNAPVVGELSL